MNLEQDEQKPHESLIEEKVRLQVVVDMAEPFELLIDNAAYQKVCKFYANAADYYQNKILALCNDLASDNDESETTVNRHYRIANVISRCVVMRDTMNNTANEAKTIIAQAREKQKRIDEINAKIQEDLTHAG